MQVVPRLIPASSTIFHEDLVMKIFLGAFLPLPLIQEEQLSDNDEKMYAKYW